MKKICVLLNGPIKNDHRVIKVIETLSVQNQIDLYYIEGGAKDKSIFNSRVRLFTFIRKETTWKKIIIHSLFWIEYKFFVKAILKEGITYDFVWCNDLPTLYPGEKIAKHIGAKLIYDTHEIYLETLNQFFPSNPKLWKSVVYRFSLIFMKTFGSIAEQRLIRKAKTVITVNMSLANYFRKKYEVRKIEIIMNFPKAIKLDLNKIIDFRKDYKFESTSKILIYQGVLNKGRGLNLLISSMKKISEEIKLIIVGDGFIKEELQELTKELNLIERVKFIDKVPLDKLLYYTSGADLGINLLENLNLSKKLASPNKLYEYIHAGIPVICSNTIENKKVIDRYKIGCLVNNNIDDISHKINTFMMKDMKINTLECKRAAEEYNWENQEKKLLNIIK